MESITVPVLYLVERTAGIDCHHNLFYCVVLLNLSGLRFDMGP